MLGLRFPSITRVALERKLKKILPKLKKGKVLYIGVHTNIYKKLIPHTEFITLDVDKSLNPDIVSDIHDIKLKSSSFDTVIAFEVLEHCYNPRKAINEMYRIAKKGGTVILSVPFMFHYHACPKDYYRFTEDSLKDLFKDFKEAKIYYVGNKVLTLWQIVSMNPLKPLFHIFNPFLAYFDFGKKTRFALNLVVVGKK